MEEESNSNYFVSIIIIVLVVIAVITAVIMFFDGIDGMDSPNQGSKSINNVNMTENLSTDHDCGITVGTTVGPYYVRDTKKLENGELNYKNFEGDKIRVSGYVYSGSTGTIPIPNAKIELWQADDKGNYHPNGNGNYDQYGEDVIALRGYIITDNDGYYSFDTIYPGYYEGRARHIHVKVSAENFDGITSQIIFMPKAGDGITYSTDSIAQSLPDCNLLTLKQEEEEVEVGSFNFRLENE